MGHPSQQTDRRVLSPGVRMDTALGGLGGNPLRALHTPRDAARSQSPRTPLALGVWGSPGCIGTLPGPSCDVGERRVLGHGGAWRGNEHLRAVLWGWVEPAGGNLTSGRGPGPLRREPEPVTAHGGLWGRFSRSHRAPRALSLRGPTQESQRGAGPGLRCQCRRLVTVGDAGRTRLPRKLPGVLCVCPSAVSGLVRCRYYPLLLFRSRGLVEEERVNVYAYIYDVREGGRNINCERISVRLPPAHPPWGSSPQPGHVP